MAKSDNLRKAKQAKNDEFYTRLEDIEAEISQHKDYVRQFEGKTVLCNCDDPEWSNFFLFFKLHFKQLKLKKLITTHFNKDGSPSYKLEWEGEMLNGDMVNLIKTPLTGDGDFRSEECVELLKEADIVVTNPPFSLFREFVEQLITYGKKFIIIGNKNAIAYKEFFPLLKDGKCFVGYNAGKGTMCFATSHTANGIGKTMNSVPSYWYTNFDLDKTREPLILTKNYTNNEDLYLNYDNFNAIECGKVKNIPKDYFGLIGVPITFIAKFCPNQFEIVGKSDELAKPILIKNKEVEKPGRFYVNQKRLYDRIIIKRKEESEE